MFPSCASAPGLFFILFLVSEAFAFGEYGGVCHMDAEEQQQCLAETVAGCDTPHSIVLFLIPEAALHYRCPEIAEDAACCRDARILILGLRPLAGEACCDSFFAAIIAGFIVCVDCVASELLDFNTREFLVILDALFYACAFVEVLKTMVFNERYAIYLNGVDLGPELHPLVFLPLTMGRMYGRSMLT